MNETRTGTDPASVVRTGGPLVAPLEAVGAGDLETAGGKGANLGELVGAGFPVPGGFVVTTDSYAAVTSGTGLADSLDRRLAAGDLDGAAIRAEFEAVTMPDELRSAIAGAYSDLGGGPVAVRSSATAEDLPGAAFAGQQDTYLNVVGIESVLEAVRSCWGSLWTDRALAYRDRRLIDNAGVRIAVVVQKMVEAETAGVLFTANPVTGARDEIVVDASSGLGEAVVSGLVTPDHYVLNQRGGVKDWKPGLREVVIRGTAGGGTCESRADDGDPTDSAQLPATVLAELARLATAVADHFGRPQDIEWAYADGQVRLLQARPMTAVPPPPIKLSAIQRKIGSFTLDYFQHRPYPLDMSTWTARGVLLMVTRMAERLGITIDFSASLREENGVVYRYIPPTPRPTWGLLAAPIRVPRLFKRFHLADWRSDERFTSYLDSLDHYRSLEMSALGWRELVRLPDLLLAEIEKMADIRADYGPRMMFSMQRLSFALGRRKLSDSYSALITGGTRTNAANDALTELAGRVRADADLAEVFAAAEPADLVRRVLTEDRFPDFRAAVDAFMVVYGHRETASPVLMSSPTWSDAPEVVLGLVKMLVADPPEVKPADLASEAKRRVLSSPRVSSARARAKMAAWIDAARDAMIFREDTHFHLTRPLPILRRTVREIGNRLRDAGVLREAGDVYHLRLDEIVAVDDVATIAESDVDRLRTVVRDRIAARDELGTVRMLDPAAVYGDTTADADALLTGTPACGGRVTAVVRVIRTPAEFGRLRSGEILVCPYTNPAWTPLFQRAAAVVVDSGGPASHAAIVAREYGLPAIMGTGTATSLLVDGQRVTVDGDTGRVLAADESA